MCVCVVRLGWGRLALSVHNVPSLDRQSGAMQQAGGGLLSYECPSKAHETAHSVCVCVWCVLCGAEVL